VLQPHYQEVFLLNFASYKALPLGDQLYTTPTGVFVEMVVYFLQELSEALDQRSQLYIDTADQLLMLSRNTLVNAR